MTIEEAIRILDPSTTLEALVEIEYYGGFNGKLAQIKACEKACEIVCEALRFQQKQANEPLTLDELQHQKFGNPVWIKEIESGRACGALVDTVNMGVETLVDLKGFEHYGKTWLAYHRKPQQEVQFDGFKGSPYPFGSGKGICGAISPTQYSSCGR